MMNFKTIAKIMAASLLAMIGLRAHAHARLESPIPRSTDSGITTGPCGTDPHTAPNVYQAGQQITINWEETIHHTGSFHIFFSPANDANLSMGATAGVNQLYQVPQTFTDDNVPHFYTATITLPNTTCSDCTIQLVQYNTDNPSSTVYYFSCADVQLTAPPPTGTPAPSPGPSPSPSPSPTPVPVQAPPPTCPLHNPTPTPTPSPTATVATFTAVNTTIIQPLCISCHSTSVASDGYSFSTYAGVLAAVNVADPTASLIYSVTSDGAMPENGTPLTAAQESLLLQWIQAGAPNN